MGSERRAAEKRTRRAESNERRLLSRRWLTFEDGSQSGMASPVGPGP
jgi:hypothetical protein